MSAPLARIAVRWPAGRLGTTALSYAAVPPVRDSYGPLAVREVRAFVSNMPLGAELAAASGVARGAPWCSQLYLDSELSDEITTEVGGGLPGHPPGVRRCKGHLMKGNADDVRELVARQLGVHDVGIDDRLVEDLSAESIDLVTVIAVIEETYGVSVEEERLPVLRTVRNLADELVRLQGTGS